MRAEGYELGHVVRHALSDRDEDERRRVLRAERRLAACLSDCGPVDLLAVTARRLPRVLATQLPDGDPRLLRVLDRLLRGVMARPRAG